MEILVSTLEMIAIPPFLITRFVTAQWECWSADDLWDSTWSLSTIHVQWARFWICILCKSLSGFYCQHQCENFPNQLRCMSFPCVCWDMNSTHNTLCSTQRPHYCCQRAEQFELNPSAWLWWLGVVLTTCSLCCFEFSVPITEQDQFNQFHCTNTYAQRCNASNGEGAQRWNLVDLLNRYLQVQWNTQFLHQNGQSCQWFHCASGRPSQSTPDHQCCNHQLCARGPYSSTSWINSNRNSERFHPSMKQTYWCCHWQYCTTQWWNT